MVGTAVSVLDECWEWQGHRDRDGYGYKKLGTRTFKTHRLACGVRASQQRTVLALVRAFAGRTSAELAARSRNVDRWTAARRLPELRAENLVRNGEPKQCGVTGKRALTWFVNEDAL